MTSTLMALKIKNYIAKTDTPSSQKRDLSDSVRERTKAQLEEYKNSRKLPLLGVKWHFPKVGDMPKDRDFIRHNVSAFGRINTGDNNSNSRELPSIDQKQGKIGRKGSVPQEPADMSLTLEDMLQEWELHQGMRKEETRKPLLKLQTDIQDLVNRDREENLSPNSKDSYLYLDKSTTSPYNGSTNREERSSRSKNSKLPHFEYNNPYDIRVKSSVRSKARSQSLTSNKEGNLLITAIDKTGRRQTRQRGSTTTSEQFQAPSKPHKPGTKESSCVSVSTCASPVIEGITQPKNGSPLVLALSIPKVSGDQSPQASKGTSKGNSKRERRSESLEEVIEFPSDVDFGLGRNSFYISDIQKSSLPLSAIDHPDLPKFKALHPNHVLMGRPLQLPLTNTMENVMKKIDSKSQKEKKPTPLDEYGKNILRGTFRDYYQEINPFGRFKGEEIELLNGLNQNFRGRRGLSICTDHRFKKEYFEDTSDSKAGEKMHQLVWKLLKTPCTSEVAEGIIKEYRKDMPNKMGREFLEMSYDVNFGKPERKETVTTRMKKYDAWYVAPKERKKRFSGAFANSSFAKNRFKHHPDEEISVETIRKVGKEIEQPAAVHC